MNKLRSFSRQRIQPRNYVPDSPGPCDEPLIQDFIVRPDQRTPVQRNRAMHTEIIHQRSNQLLANHWYFALSEWQLLTRLHVLTTMSGLRRRQMTREYILKAGDSIKMSARTLDRTMAALIALGAVRALSPPNGSHYGRVYWIDYGTGKHLE